MIASSMSAYKLQCEKSLIIKSDVGSGHPSEITSSEQKSYSGVSTLDARVESNHVRLRSREGREACFGQEKLVESKSLTRLITRD